MKKTMGLILLSAVGLSLFFLKNDSSIISKAIMVKDEKKLSVTADVLSLDSFKEDPTFKNSKNQVASIRKISTKVLLSKIDKENLYDQLENKELQEKIRTKLSDTSLMSNDHLKERLGLLDVLYEGIKSQRTTLSDDYLKVASEILTVKNPFDEKTQKLQFAHFVGDRAELSFFVSKISGEKYKTLKEDALAKNEQSSVYFKTTAKLSELYQVAL